MDNYDITDIDYRSISSPVSNFSLIWTAAIWLKSKLGIRVHPALVSRLSALTPLVNWHHFLIYALSFSVQCNLVGSVLRLTPYFLWEYHFLFNSFWFTPTFSGTKLRRKTRAGCIHHISLNIRWMFSASGKCNFLPPPPPFFLMLHNARSAKKCIIQQMQSLIHHLWHIPTPCFHTKVPSSESHYNKGSVPPHKNDYNLKMLKNEPKLACWLIYLCYNDSALLCHIF